MKFVNPSYHTVRKITALLLLMAFLIPSGLNAKQLAEFCMPGHHGDMGMMADHSCCQPVPEKPNASDHQQHDCDEASLCTCNISESVRGEEKFIQPVKKQILQPTETELKTSIFTSKQPKQAETKLSPTSNDIPLWLMFDTFLM